MGETREPTERTPAKPGLLRRLLQIDDSAESIARGVALGVFVAMTPTVGVQMIIIAIVNTVCRANRLAGLLMVYISNPLTMVPIYWVDYQVGRWLLGQPSISHEDFAAIFEVAGPNLLSRLGSFVERLGAFSWEVAGPLFVGGVLVGAVCALPSYTVTLWALRRRSGCAEPSQ
jgi:uncharacterized protein